MTKTKKKQNIPICIFCNSSPLTEEHLWPQWMEKEFPKEGEDKHLVLTHKSLDSYGSRTQYSSKILKRNVLRMTVKKVCEKCNNGWMSRIEEESKEIIKSLIRDEPISMGPNEQIQLSRWGVLKSIIGEYADKENTEIAVSAQERLHFYETKKASSRFSVWIGRSLAKQGVWKTPFFIHYTSYLNHQNLIHTLPPNPNTQWSLFVKNTFIIIIFWCEKQCDLILPPVVEKKLFKIEPITESLFEYNSIPYLSEDEMNYIRENLHIHSFAVVE